MSLNPKHTYLPHDWERVCLAPLWVWQCIASVDLVVESTHREYDAFEKSLRECRERYKNVSVVVRVVDEAVRPSANLRSGVTSSSVDDSLSRLREVVATVERVETEAQVRSFKEFLVAFAWDLARASNESVVPFGLNVSQAEEGFIFKFQRLLGLLEK